MDEELTMVIPESETGFQSRPRAVFTNKDTAIQWANDHEPPEGFHWLVAPVPFNPPPF